MKKVKESIIIIIVVIALSLMPFSIFADNSTYSVIDNNSLLWTSSSNTNRLACIINNTSEIRAVAWYSTGTYYIYSVSKNNYSANRTGYDETCSGVSYYNATSQSFNNEQYYFSYWQFGGYNTLNVPLITYDNSKTYIETAYYYTFGDGAIAPEEPVVYGDLTDVGFYTNFTNSQQSTFSAMKNNVDTIKWNGFQDSLGNPINTSGFRVQIQAAVVDYEANTKSDLLNQTISDMITGDWTDLITISANVGEKSFNWENVAQTLLSTNYNLDFWNKLSIFQGYNQQSQLKYMKEGWIYRIRLLNLTDEYEGDWQIVYTLQGAPAGDSEGTIQHIYNYNTTIPEQTVYNDCDNINNYNNTTNNWYMNGTPMDVTNNNESWVEKLIKFIIGVVDKIAGLIDKLINIILDVFGSVLDGLVDLILGLFDGINLKDLFFGWFSDLKDYIEGIDLTLPVFNLPTMPQVNSFNRLVQETMDIFIDNNLGFVLFIPLILLIVRIIL